MTLSTYAGYVIVPLHLAAGFLFGVLPGSVYQPGWYTGYGAILTLLAATLWFYVWAVRCARPVRGVVWLQVLLAVLAAAAPFFTVDFADAWHAIVYLPILGGSLLACLVAGLVARKPPRG